MTTLTDMTKAQLLDLAKENEITGRHDMSRPTWSTPWPSSWTKATRTKVMRSTWTSPPRTNSST